MMPLDVNGRKGSARVHVKVVRSNAGTLTAVI